MDQVTRRSFLATASLLPSTAAIDMPAQGQGKPAPKETKKPAPQSSGQATSEGNPNVNAVSSPAKQVLERLKHWPYLRGQLGWKVAFTQHSMYMLIDEDRGVPMVGERTTPWGAPDAAVYVERIRRNLASVEKNPGLVLTYDFPGADFEAIERDFPDVITKLQEMHRKGVVDFVNGSYSSAHLQNLSSESNWRQFEYGLAVFERLFGKKVKLFTFQENALTQQLPQILSQFGFEMITAPGGFPWAAEIVEGPFEFVSEWRGTNFLRNEEFVWAEALDGTSLPFYLVQPTPVDGLKSDWNIKRGIDLGMAGPPPVWLYCPDMEEVDRKTYDSYSELFDFVLLEPALAERFKLAPPRAKARIFAYWSYAEGVWAEEYLRANRAAELAALQAESIQAMGRQAGSPLYQSSEIGRIWRDIIHYQSHDVTWIEVTDMRREAINQCAEGALKSQRVSEAVARTLAGSDSSSIAIFNGLPAPRRAVIEIEGKDVPEGGPPFQEFEGRAWGVRELPAGGFKSFPVGSALPAKEISLPPKINTMHYGVEFSGGLIEQLTTADGKNLLKPGSYLGGEMRAMIHDQWKDNRSADCRFFEGEVCYILSRASSLGEIPVEERYFFFRNENFIKAQVEFDFHANEVGNFWLDETKLNVYYPTAGTDIYYDIPFGYVAGRADRPLFPTNWIYCGGLAYVNWGTVKHWVKEGVIANVLAWGGNVFDNRMDFDFWTSHQQYDLRLYGKQKIKYALIPYSEFDGNRVVRDVSDLTTPVFVTKGSGEKSFYELKNRDLAVTAVYEKEGKVWARGCRLPSDHPSKWRNWEIFNAPVEELT
jgi:hypothetical protein